MSNRSLFSERQYKATCYFSGTSREVKVVKEKVRGDLLYCIVSDDASDNALDGLMFYMVSTNNRHYCNNGRGFYLMNVEDHTYCSTKDNTDA